MAKLFIQDTTLTAIADAIRAKGSSALAPTVKVVRTPNTWGFEASNYRVGALGNSASGTTTYEATIESAAKLKIKLSWALAGSFTGGNLKMWSGKSNITPSSYIVNNTAAQPINTVEYECNGDTVAFAIATNTNRLDNNYYGFYAEVTGYDANGNQICNGNPLKEIYYSEGYYENGGIPANTALNKVITIPGATKLEFINYSYYSSATCQMGYSAGVKEAPTGFGSNLHCDTQLSPSMTEKSYLLENTDTITVNVWCKAGQTTNYYGIYFEVVGYDADGNVILEGGAPATYTPLEMPAAILAISGEGGGGITPEGEIEITVNGDYDVTSFAGAHVAVPVGIFPTGLLNIYDNGLYNIAEYEQVNVLVPTGGSDDIDPIVLKSNQANAFSSAVAQAFVKAHPDKISTEYLTVTTSMFENYGLPTVPFSLNWENWGDPATSYPNGYSTQYMFRYSAIEALPEMNFVCTTSPGSMFMNCTKLREIPEGFTSNWYWNPLHQVGRTYAMNYGFYNCYSLTNIDSHLLKNWWCNNAQNYGSSYAYLVQNCYNLNELCGLGVSKNVEHSSQNVFYYTFLNNYCMKRFTFDLDNGQAIAANWKNQIIDLTTNFGYWWGSDMSNNFYNSGRTLDDRVYDATSYAANKNKKNAYVACTTFEDALGWSLYNKAAAEETVRSLPNCSASGGTNTIKFLADQGGFTNEGAIGSMSEEVIALAASKGWTVTLS